MEGIDSGGVLIAHNDTDYIHGVVLLDNGPMLVVCRPILTGPGESPHAGTLIFGKYLDDSYRMFLENRTKTSLELYTLNQEMPPPIFRRHLI